MAALARPLALRLLSQGDLADGGDDLRRDQAAQQLDYYLDEFTFRFNRRSSSHRGLLFYRLLEQPVQLEHVPLAAIVGGHLL